MLNTFLYKFTAGSSVMRVAKVSQPLTYEGEEYIAANVTHTLPTWSSEPRDAEIDVTIRDNTELAELLLTPPPYPITLDIYEWLDEEVFHYYRGWVVRSQMRPTEPLAILHLKTVWHFFEREAISASLGSTSRYSIYDPRAGVDLSALKQSVIVTEFNDQRDILTVTGATQIDGWFRGGYIEAPNLDKRTILEDVTESGDRHLTLNGGFSRFTLDVGFPADLYPGDDLLYSTWAVKFDAFTNNGEAWGGWEFTPTVDPVKRGVI